MAGMQFEYDEKGGTFYYFLLSFMALVLIPASYYLWPREQVKEESEKNKRHCHCEACQEKRRWLKDSEPWTNFRRNAIKIGILIGWILFIAVAYKASQVEIDFTEFDPYKELGIDRGASSKEIRKAYHQLTLTHHPDKGGDEQRFLRITKAYKALTDEESRKNWEEYGNPDGPGATHFGIALPKWIVEKQNSVWVLAVYCIVFMIILPVVVGTWWYRSIKYSTEQILMDTMHLYGTFFQRTPNMMLKRVIMILAASMEFEKGHNHEIVERPSDNEELPMLMRDLPHLKEKNKIRPFCFPYSVKARALIHAHFSRISLPPKTLELDRRYILKKCPYLINEMVNIVAQLVAYARAGRCMMPRLETIENCMKVSPMVIQGLWDSKNPLLQLPHITEDRLRHFVTRRRNIRTIQQLARMKEDERRSLLRTLNDADYMDIMNILSTMPYITLEVKSEVLDDEDTTIAAGDIVTVFVKLIRQNMEVLFAKESDKEEEVPMVEEEKVEEEEEMGQGDNNLVNEEAPGTPQAAKQKVWEKNKKKKGGKGGKKGGKKPVKQQFVKKQTGPAAATQAKTEDSPTMNGQIVKPKKAANPAKDDLSDNEEDASGSDSEGNAGNESDTEDVTETEAPKEDDDDWLKFQEESKRDNILDAKSKETHPVHCPHFPLEKYEWWWLYVADKKNHQLITAPLQVCSLKTEDEVQLKFCAPSKPGLYQYTVCLRSDSYFDMDLHHNIKLDVKEAKKVESHPQWEISDDEEEKEDEEGSDSTMSDGSDYSDED